MTERKRNRRSRSDYAVGYGKPPTEHQFKKGQPRPPRKPKETPDRTLQDYLAAELKVPIRIKENDVEKLVSKGEAVAKASLRYAIKEGDPRRLKGLLPPPRPQEDFDFSEIDLTIVARFMAQVLKQHQLPARDHNEGRDEHGGDGKDDGYDGDMDKEAGQ